jgi:predicted nuclease with TOPRIM domain
MTFRTPSTLHSLRLLLAATALAALASGCETYIDAKRNIAPGGQLERDTSEARQNLVDVKRENAELQDAKARRERELEENERRIQALESDMRQQDAALTKALQARQVTKARYDQLKRNMDSIRKETAALAQQNDADRLASVSDKKADAAKEERLRALEKRKKELETALAAVLKR